ncbi:hypothetical protein VTK26DRAFT_6015 [Humicola hyalothermophila]
MSPKTFEYPGVHLPRRYLRQKGEHGVDFFRFGSSEDLWDTSSKLLQVREVAMMILMDRLTDKPNWHEKVFDEEIVSKWRQEALTQDEEALHREILGGKDLPMFKRTRIISEEAFDYCIAELRCKAAHFKESGLTFTLNAGPNTIIKSDSVVGDELRNGLKAAFEKLQADQAARPDWHPNTNDTVQDLVHPSMYPFIYGKSTFFEEEVVGVADAIDKWAGKGKTVPTRDVLGTTSSRQANINVLYWSDTYQWLPANLAFQEDGTVKFTSYINGLHPKRYPEVYRLVEKLIDTAIPAWDRVLTGEPIVMKNGNSALQERFSLPDEIWEDDDEEKAFEALNEDVLAAHETEHGAIEYYESDLEYLDRDPDLADWTLEAREEYNIKRLKWKKIREAKLKEPLPFEPVTYQVKNTLYEKFKDTGLQVIVKMASIELTPEKPDFPVGGWHIEGQLNEHIVATALYYLDSENVTPSRLSFRMRTSYQQSELQERVGQARYTAYEHLYGTRLEGGVDAANVQTYGSVETREGRLLAFPNVFQHRVSSFQLADKTKPGHRRFIALWLVDPFTRIISTGNVPPQQLDWWAEAVFGGSGGKVGDMPPELVQLLLEQGVAESLRSKSSLLPAYEKLGNRLPAEVMDMVRKVGSVPEGLMTYEEAYQHRLKLMGERSVFRAENEDEWTNEYSFCEH